MPPDEVSISPVRWWILSLVLSGYNHFQCRLLRCRQWFHHASLLFSLPHCRQWRLFCWVLLQIAARAVVRLKLSTLEMLVLPPDPIRMAPESFDNFCPADFFRTVFCNVAHLTRQSVHCLLLHYAIGIVANNPLGESTNRKSLPKCLGRDFF